MSKYTNGATSFYSFTGVTSPDPNENDAARFVEGVLADIQSFAERLDVQVPVVNSQLIEVRQIRDETQDFRTEALTFRNQAQDHRAESEASAQDAKASELEARDYADDSLGHSQTSLGHANTSEAYASEASDHADAAAQSALDSSNVATHVPAATGGTFSGPVEFDEETSFNDYVSFSNTPTVNGHHLWHKDNANVFIDYNGSSVADVVPGSTFGTLLEGTENAHVVIGVRGNGDSDGFHVIDTNNNGAADYERLILSVTAAGLTYLGNEVYHSGNDGLDSNVDAGKLGGVNSRKFPRIDTGATIDAYWRFARGLDYNISSTGGNGHLGHAGKNNILTHAASDGHTVVRNHDGSTYEDLVKVESTGDLHMVGRGRIIPYAEMKFSRSDGPAYLKTNGPQLYIQPDGNTAMILTGSGVEIKHHVYMNNRDINGVGKIKTRRVETDNGDTLALAAGETGAHLFPNAGGEQLWLGAEGGVKIVSTPDNWTSGWGGRNEGTLVDGSGNSRLPGNLDLQNNGEITARLGKFFDFLQFTTTNHAYVQAKSPIVFQYNGDTAFQIRGDRHLSYRDLDMQYNKLRGVSRIDLSGSDHIEHQTGEGLKYYENGSWRATFGHKTRLPDDTRINGGYPSHTARNPNEPGSILFCKKVQGGGAAVGETVFGNTLRPSSANGKTGAYSLTGSWKCLGLIDEGDSTNFIKVAG